MVDTAYVTLAQMVGKWGREMNQATRNNLEELRQRHPEDKQLLREIESAHRDAAKNTQANLVNIVEAFFSENKSAKFDRNRLLARLNHAETGDVEMQKVNFSSEQKQQFLRLWFEIRIEHVDRQSDRLNTDSEKDRAEMIEKLGSACGHNGFDVFSALRQEHTENRLMMVTDEIREKYQRKI